MTETKFIDQIVTKVPITSVKYKNNRKDVKHQDDSEDPDKHQLKTPVIITQASSINPQELGPDGEPSAAPTQNVNTNLTLWSKKTCGVAPKAVTIGEWGKMIKKTKQAQKRLRGPTK